MEVHRYLADVVVACDTSGTVHSPGFVDVANGLITRVGSSESFVDSNDTVVSHDVGGLLMPGLVNTHCHTPMTLMRGVGDGLPLADWLGEVMPRERRMNPEDAWWGMVLGSAEMLRSGVTTSCEMYLFEEAVTEAVLETGARLVMTPGFVSALHGADHFVTRISDVSDFYSRYHHSSGRITVGIGAHSAYDLGVPRCRELANLAQSLDSVLHIHVAETREESGALEAEYGKSIVEILADEEVLGGRVLAAHCVWLDQPGIEVLAETGTAVAHCPVSNMKLGSGIAPVWDLSKAGVVVGLGTDGPASNDTLDLWEDIKVAGLLARVRDLDPAVFSASDLLSMATREAAKAVGLDGIGVLAEGFGADMIRIDLDDSMFVPITEAVDVLTHLVWSGSNRVVTDVWVAGVPVVVGGQVMNVDEDRARAEVNVRAMRLVGI